MAVAFIFRSRILLPFTYNKPRLRRGHVAANNPVPSLEILVTLYPTDSVTNQPPCQSCAALRHRSTRGRRA